MRLEIDAWVVNNFSAVRRKLLSLATQTKVSRNFKFMGSTFSYAWIGFY